MDVFEYIADGTSATPITVWSSITALAAVASWYGRLSTIDLSPCWLFVKVIYQILNQVVLLMFRQHYGLTFQHDNERPHVAHVTRDFLADNNINLMEWPAVSPECNPIEHM